MEAEQEQHESQNSDSMEAEQEQHEPQNSDQRARETSYKKRNPTVMKKANELSQLCNIPVCVISYGPDGNVDTWPEGRDDVVEVLNKYKEHNGIHKKYPFVNKEKNNNKEEKEEDEEEEEDDDDDEEEEDEEDVDESEEHEERNKVEEFERVLLAWEYGWLYDTDDEKLFEMRLNSLKTKLCVMKNRIELLEHKKRKWCNNNNNNNNSTTGIPNNNNNYEVGSSSGSSRAKVARAFKLMGTIRRLNLAKMSLSRCSQ